MELIKREARVCFRTSRLTEEALVDIGDIVHLPRSAVAYLLVEVALVEAMAIRNKADWWELVGHLPPSVLAAALRQERGE